MNKESPSNLIFICEHASHYIPPAYNDLGLLPDQRQRHIAWDIGAGNLTKALAEKLSASAINAHFSRLLIDPNRALDQNGLIPQKSDKTHISGNQDLSKNEIQNRIDNYYNPFHNAVSNLIDDHSASHPLIFNIHSFTPVMNDTKRPWKIGLLWNEDQRLRDIMLPELSQAGFNVGDNQPYSGKELFFTLDHHAAPRKLPHIMIEIRQDQINTDKGITEYCDILAPIIKKYRTALNKDKS